MNERMRLLEAISEQQLRRMIRVSSLIRMYEIFLAKIRNTCEDNTVEQHCYSTTILLDSNSTREFCCVCACLCCELFLSSFASVLLEKSPIIRKYFICSPRGGGGVLRMTETVGADEDNSNNDSMNDNDDEDSRNSDESRDSHDSFDIDDVIRKIGGREADDYKMSKLTIGEHEYLPDDENWEVLGRAIGRNSHLREVAFYDCHEYFIRQEDLLTFLPGFVMNRSIQKLRLAGLDLNDKVTSLVTHQRSC